MADTKRIVKVDVDGVLRDILTPMIELYNNEFGESMTLYSITDYNVDKCFPKIRECLGISAAEYFFNRHGDRLFGDRRNVMADAAESLRRLREHKYYVMIVTDQPAYTNKLNTLRFLEENGIEYDDIMFTKNKHLIKAGFIIDDNPAMLNKEPKNVCRICVNYPYNKDVKCNVRTINIRTAVDYIIYFDHLR